MDIWNVNKQVAKAKEKHIKKYHDELSLYIDKVSRLALYEIADNPDFNKYTTSTQGDLSDDLGILLLSPPDIGDLSLPEFLEKGSTEVINLPEGYLYISIDKGNKTYHLSYHENTSDLNPYLDMGRTFADTLPTLLRQGTIVGTSSMMITRIYDVLKLFKFI